VAQGSKNQKKAGNSRKKTGKSNSGKQTKKQETFSLRKTSPAIGDLLWNGLLHTCFLPAAFSAGSKAICCIPPRQAHPIFCTQSCKKVVKRTEKFASSADNQRLLNWGARRAAFRPYFL